ncbi:Fructosamine/Ketosamine-3-kinase [Xylariomycetidae sp. FL2044]|nr:Fructosamine/Ketosamine-3-kinase [Xylariomycetidae sp. FL2044]
MESLDPAILKCLPEGINVVKRVEWGLSGWTDTSRLTTELPDGTVKEYFLKTCSAEVAHDMFKGEFKGLETMYELFPTACPKPRGWGECHAEPGTFFVIMDFLYFVVDEHPSPDMVGRLVSELHKKTAGTSPNGQFGFYVPTCHGKVVQPNQWDTNWSRYFSNLLTVFYDVDMAVNGSFPAYEEAFAIVKQDVIPRLLGALQSEGRVLKPCLVHGDLWHPNIGLSKETDEPMIYDPALFYGHNEFEIGMWNTTFVEFGKPYREIYVEYYGRSEPTAEWDDRNRLYSMFFHISHSAHWPSESKATRIRILEDMQFLINKYAV